MSDFQKLQSRPLTFIEGRSVERYSEDRPSLRNLTPVDANHIVAAMLYTGGMDHLRMGVDAYAQPTLWTDKGEKPVGPKVMVQAANFTLDTETYFHEILAPARHGSGEFHSLLAGLGQYALASIGKSEVSYADMKRLGPVFAQAWQTIDEAKMSDDSAVRNVAEVLDQAIHAGMERGQNKRQLVAR